MRVAYMQITAMGYHTQLPMTLVCLAMVCLSTLCSGCIDNPMDPINEKARKQYQLTDEVLDDMEKNNLVKYRELLRIYGIYRACIESGTKRWTGNVGKDGTGDCPYCRNKIEQEDKITTRPQPKVRGDKALCEKDDFCHISPQGCFYYGRQASEAQCRILGQDWGMCTSNNITGSDCQSCIYDRILQTYCPMMCAYCKSHCGLYCKNGGTLNQKTCSCSCHSIFSGVTCEHTNCPAYTPTSLCARRRPVDCRNIFAMPHYVTCPYVCKVCDESERPTCDEDPNCYVSARGCQHQGPPGSGAQCKALPNGGKDEVKCGTLTCEHCGPPHVMRTCPVMCGICV